MSNVNIKIDRERINRKFSPKSNLFLFQFNAKQMLTKITKQKQKKSNLKTKKFSLYCETVLDRKKEGEKERMRKQMTRIKRREKE